MYGPTNTGKTELAKALLGPVPLLVTHLDDLKSWDPDMYSGLVYDEANLLHLPREGQLHHLTLDHNVSIHARYFPAYLTKGRKTIFTTNRRPHEVVLFGDPAVNRRVQVVYVHGLNDYEPWDLDSFFPPPNSEAAKYVPYSTQ